VNWDSISAPSAKPPRSSKDHFSQLVQMVLFRGDKIGVQQKLQAFSVHRNSELWEFTFNNNYKLATDSLSCTYTASPLVANVVHGAI